MLTLEQRRANDAWERSENYTSEHVKLAKGLPALIMTSGLMQVLAYLNTKDDKHRAVSADLRSWLYKRFPSLQSEDFEPFMQSLLKASPREYQAITTEAFAWLKWLRQMAAARKGAR
jgi:CRISPR-associated protein Cmr5